MKLCCSVLSFVLVLVLIVVVIVGVVDHAVSCNFLILKKMTLE